MYPYYSEFPFKRSKVFFPLEFNRPLWTAFIPSYPSADSSTFILSTTGSEFQISFKTTYTLTSPLRWLQNVGGTLHNVEFLLISILYVQQYVLNKYIYIYEYKWELLYRYTMRVIICKYKGEIELIWKKNLIPLPYYIIFSKAVDLCIIILQRFIKLVVRQMLYDDYIYNKYSVRSLFLPGNKSFLPKTIDTEKSSDHCLNFHSCIT